MSSVWRGATSRFVLRRIATRCVGLLGNLYSGPDERGAWRFYWLPGRSGILGRGIGMAFSVRFWGLLPFSSVVVEWRSFALRCAAFLLV